MVLTGRAISLPFRARFHRFATVNHGHSRLLTGAALYRVRGSTNGKDGVAEMVRWGHIWATTDQIAADSTGHYRFGNIPAQQLTTASIAGPLTATILSRTEEVARVPVGHNPIRGEDDPNGHRAKDNSGAGP
jgi:hypothetical protein